MPQQIPTQPDDPNYSISCTLDGSDYKLTFRYSGRENVFYLDLYSTDGTLLCGGRKVVCLFPIWTQFNYDKRIPQGALVAIPVAGGSDAPAGFDADGNGELGDGRRVQLLYYTADEVAAAVAAQAT